MSNSFSLSSHIISFLLLFPIIHSTSTPFPTKPTQLVNKVCKQTSSYSFCVSALYSDDRTPQADDYTLAFISVGLAYLNSTNTLGHISKMLKNISSHNQYYRPLQQCTRDYKKANLAIESAHNDLDSETFFDLDDSSRDVASAVDDCEAGFKGIRSHPLMKRNQDLKILVEIYAVIAKLFTGEPL